jgi:hypothetical protein
MRQGIKDEFLVKNQTVDNFMKIYEKVLEDNEFKFKEKIQEDVVLRHIAIWGEGKKAFKRSLIPGGALTEKGNRYASEVEISQQGGDVRFKIHMVPYMSLHDKPDKFLITQGPMERVMDDEFCKEKMLKIVTGLRENQMEMISQT